MDLSKLTPPQREAVEHTYGPCRVFAGPGSGKTHVLTLRLARLIESGVPVDRILCCTFTKKAAEEMRKRVENQLGVELSRPWIGTIHSQFYKILRSEIASDAGSWDLRVMEGADERIQIARCIKKEGLNAVRATFDDRAMLKRIDSWRMQMIRPDDIDNFLIETAKETPLEEFFSDSLFPSTLPGGDALLVLATRQLAVLYRAYQRMKSEEGWIDFTDMVFRTWDILERNEALRAKWANRFDFILVDEMQDIDPCQWESVKYLARPKNNIFVVGDDDQSIYSFRGASPEIMLGFSTDFPGARTVMLEQNFRCPQNIIDHANQGIGNNQVRQAKKLFSANPAYDPDIIDVPEDEEAEAVANYIQGLIEAGDGKYSDICVVYRINAQSAPFESVFMEREIPYEIKSGTCFFDKREVADLVAYFELALGNVVPDLVSRVANKASPPRMISKKSIGIWRNNPTLQNLGFCRGTGLESWETRNLGKLYSDLVYLQGIGRQPKMTTDRLLDAILECTRYEDHCRKEGEEMEADDDFAGTLAALRVEARRHPSPPEFLVHVARAREYARNQKRRRNSVLLSTFHGVKGLEWRHVILVGMNEGLIPHQKSIDSGNLEEERRLAHVGLTRTKKSMLISVTGTPSRFVVEWFTGAIESKVPYSARLAKTLRNETDPSSPAASSSTAT